MRKSDRGEALKDLAKAKNKQVSRISQIEFDEESGEEIDQERLSDLKKDRKKSEKRKEKIKPQIHPSFLVQNQSKSSQKDTYLSSMLDDLDGDVDETFDDLDGMDLEEFDISAKITKPLPQIPLKKKPIEVVQEDLDFPEFEKIIEDASPLEIEKNFDMYLLDAYEEKHGDGTIYLFGKVQGQSACIVIKNMERNVYILHQEDDDVLISLLMKKHGIRKYSQKLVDRKYCFEKEGMQHGTSKFVKIVYPFTSKVLEIDSKTFPYSFGTHTGALELFLIKRKIKGPCWITISNSSKPQVNVSWTKHEFIVLDSKSIKVAEKQSIPPPDLKMMSIRMRTLPQGEHHEIIMISAICHSSVAIEANPTLKSISKFTLIRKVDQFGSLPTSEEYVENEIEVCNGESHLLVRFFDHMLSFDPDVIVGHNFLAWDLDIILSRCSEKNVKNWSQLGRLSRSKIPKQGTFEQHTLSGRLCCDTYIAARDYLRESNYSLKHLCKSQLGKNDLKPIENDIEFLEPYYANAKNVIALAKNNEYFGLQQISLSFHMTLLTLTKELANAAGSLWSRALVGNRAERTEYLLLHEFHAKKFITPDKEYVKKEKGKKADYAGGLVIQPQKGLYDKYILLLDFVSLYPSIILEKNLCFTTVERKKEDQDVMTVVVKDDVESVLPKVIKLLLERRGVVKGLMSKEKDVSKKWQLNIKQNALKLIANSTYGCLGFPASRFYCKTIAELITAVGRDNLIRTKAEIEKLGYPIVYGDTDSVMVLTPFTEYQKAYQTGTEIIGAINKLHKNLALNIDGLFRKMLLLEKKKYVALVHTLDEKGAIFAKIERKGIDMVRRDWCDLSKQVSKYIVDQILSDSPTETVVNNIHQHLREVASTVKTMELEKFILTKELSKAPQDYPDAKTLPHVMVAKRMLEQGQNVQTKQRILYVICANQGKSLSERAHSVMEYESLGNLVLDYEWYLTAQVHPPILRLCKYIEGTDSALLAECLGLDSTKFHSLREESDSMDWITNEDEKYKNVVLEPLVCSGCKQVTKLNPYGRLIECANGGDVPLLSCSLCLTKQSCSALSDWIHRNIHGWQKKFNQGNRVTSVGINNTIGLSTNHCFVSGKVIPCTIEFTSTDLYLHLSYMNSLFNISNMLNKAENDITTEKSHVIKTRQRLIDEQEEMDQFKECHDITEYYLSRCAYRYVNLSSIFKIFQ